MSTVRGPARLVAVLALTAALATACSEEDAQQAVDRAKDEVSSAIDDAGLQDKLDELAENADCAGLRRELAKVEGDDTEVTRYIKDQLRNADC